MDTKIVMRTRTFLTLLLILFLATVLTVADASDNKGQSTDEEMPQLHAILQQASTAARDITTVNTPAATPQVLEEHKAGVLLGIAILQSRAGDIKGAMETVSVIPIKNEGRNVGRKEAGLGYIAAAQAKAGDLQAGLKTIAAIKNANWKAGAAHRILTALVEVGRPQEALQLSGALPLGSMKARDLASIATAQAKLGGQAVSATTFLHALKSVDAESDTTGKYLALEAIAKAQADAGDKAGSARTFQQAIQVIAALPEPGKRAGAFRVIAQARAHVGDQAASIATFTLALQAAAAIADHAEKARAFLNVSKAQAEAGYSVDSTTSLQQAIQAANLVADDRKKVRTLAAIMSWQAKIGDSAASAKTAQQAIQIAQTISNDNTRAAMLQEIAFSQAYLGDGQGALKTADAIKVDYWKSEALRHIAMKQVGVGNNGDLFTRLRKSAAGIPKEAAAPETLRNIATVQAAAGDLQGALHAIEAIPNDRIRAFALEDIVAMQIEMGDLQRAVQTAISIREDSEGANTMRKVARAQARARDVRGALSWSLKQTASNRKALALLGIAEGTLERLGHKVKEDDTYCSATSYCRGVLG